MRKFEGNINGKVYTNETDFNNALLDLDSTKNIVVSYRFTSVPDLKNETKLIDDGHDNECGNIVSETDYIKGIINTSEIDVDLIKKLKNASNKTDIYHNVIKRIEDFDVKISDNLLHINELKSDYKKLDEKIKLINNQIKTLDDANNNYYLQKEYYSNIKNLVQEEAIEEVKEESRDEQCCGCGSCTCGVIDDVPSTEDIYNMTPKEIKEFLNRYNINNLSDLVNFFIENC
jgi:hypothetical protein